MQEHHTSWRSAFCLHSWWLGIVVYYPFGLTGFLLAIYTTVNDFYFALQSYLTNVSDSLGGTWGVPAVVFVETGLFFGFFLPVIPCWLLLGLGIGGSAEFSHSDSFDNLGSHFGISELLHWHQSGEALADRFQLYAQTLSVRAHSTQA